MGARSFCDTRPFLEGWQGLDGQMVNPHQQQDSHELLLEFLNYMPKEIPHLSEG
jgi:hypothetical protein